MTIANGFVNDSLSNRYGAGIFNEDVNDGRAGFNPKPDMVIDVTGISFQRPQDALAGAILSVSNYFV